MKEKSICKILIIVILSLLILNLCTVNKVNAWWVEPNTLDTMIEYKASSGNYYPETYVDYNGVYHKGNCTWYCWGRTNQKLGKKLPTTWGDAGSWYNNAARDGYTVSQTPRTDSIIVWSGHVAYVEKWDGTNLYLSECNWDNANNGNSHAYNERIGNDYCNANGYGSHGEGKFVGFIYLTNSEVDIDTEKPVITSAYVDPASMTGSSYTVKVFATDNVGISKIPIMTWSIDNGQDDIKEYRATSNGSGYSYTVKASNHGNNKGLYNSNVYVYDEAGNGILKELSKIPMNTKVVKNLGSFEARIVLKSNQDYVITANGTQQNANVILGKKSDSDKSQIWKFNKKSDGSYEIVNAVSNRALDITDAKDEDGTNVAIHSRNNSEAQTFYIMEYNGGYRIVPKCTSNLKAIDLSDNKVEIGKNIDLYNVYNIDNTAQVWVFENSQITLGDVNEDGTIDTEDAVMILKHLAGNITLSDSQRVAADTSKDGSIDTEDAVRILKKLAGNITEF